MRATRHVFTASAVFVLTIADPKTVVGNRHPTSAVNVSTVSFRLITSALDAPRKPHLRDSEVAAPDDDSRIDEERACLDILSRMSYAVRQRLLILHPADFLEHLSVHHRMDQTIFDESLTKWLEYVKKYNAKWWEAHVFDDGEIVDLLKEKFGANRKLVTFLRSLRAYPAWTMRSDNWQRMLAAKGQETLESMVRCWLLLAVRPDEAFELMPIASMKRLTGDVTQNKDEWRIVKRELDSWLYYVQKFDKRYYKTPYDSKKVVALLLRRRGVDETAAILSESNSSPSLVFGWAKELAAIHPDTVKRMIPGLMERAVDPKEVLEIMPVVAQIRAHGVAEDKKWPAFQSELKLFQNYVDRVRGFKCDDCNKSLAELLIAHSKLEDVWAFVDDLEADNVLGRLAVRLKYFLPDRPTR